MLTNLPGASWQRNVWRNLTLTWGGIHLGWVEPASPIQLTTSRTEALQTRRSCASSQEPFAQSCIDEDSRSRERFKVFLEFRGPPPQLSSSSFSPRARRYGLEEVPDHLTLRHLAAWPNQRSLLRTSCVDILAWRGGAAVLSLEHWWLPRKRKTPRFSVWSIMIWFLISISGLINVFNVIHRSSPMTSSW